MSQFEAGNSLNRTEMSQNLRGSLQRAISYADEQSHRQVTLEHLLLALADDREAGVILQASAVNVPALMTEVSDYLGRLEDRAMENRRRQPALGSDIQHIIQSAGAAAQKSKRNAVSSALVLAAIVGDGRSPSAQMLRNHGMTFESAIAALKQANAAETARPVGPAVAVEPSQPASRPIQPQPLQSQPLQQEPTQPAVVEVSPQPKAAPQQRSAAVGAPNTGAGGVRLQNMQAAHEIIASARERIAAARGTVAVHAGEAGGRPAQSGSQAGSVTAERRTAVPKRTPEPVEATAPPPTHVQAAVAPKPPAQQAAAPQLAVPQRPNNIASPSGPVPQQSATPVVHDVRPVQQMPPHVATPPPRPAAQQPVSAMPPQPVAQPMALPTPPPNRAPSQQPPVYRQAASEMSPAPAYDVPSSAQPASQQGVPHPDNRPVRASVADGYDHSPAPEYSASRPSSSELALAVRPIEPEKLTEFVPTRMCVGVPTTIEIRAPRARLEAWSGGNGDPHERDGQIITKAMVMRLKAPEGGFTVEIASPETQWSEGYMGPLSDDVVSWRWIVTPVQRGRRPLQLNVSTRVVCRDGLAAARSLPEQLVSIRVAPNYGRQTGRLAIWIFLALSGTALGYFGDRLFNMGSSMLAQVVQ
jgi:hypothetical protein